MPVNLESKANKRKLRQLAGVAYERELGAALSTVGHGHVTAARRTIVARSARRATPVWRNR